MSDCGLFETLNTLESYVNPAPATTFRGSSSSANASCAGITAAITQVAISHALLDTGSEETACATLGIEEEFDAITDFGGCFDEGDARFGISASTKSAMRSAPHAASLNSKYFLVFMILCL
jgi:hypothetical protein